jgi:hypothetical protein
MLAQRIKRTDPEKIFMIFKNSYSTESLANGQVVQIDFTTDGDGVGVTVPSGMATNFGTAVAGVAVEAIAHNAYGLVQVYGYHSAMRVRACTSADAIAVGADIRPPLAAGVFCGEGHDPNGTLNYKPMAFNLGAAWSSWTTTTRAAFIKAL